MTNPIIESTSTKVHDVEDLPSLPTPPMPPTVTVKDLDTISVLRAQALKELDSLHKSNADTKLITEKDGQYKTLGVQHHALATAFEEEAFEIPGHGVIPRLFEKMESVSAEILHKEKTIRSLNKESHQTLISSLQKSIFDLHDKLELLNAQMEQPLPELTVIDTELSFIEKTLSYIDDAIDEIEYISKAELAKTSEKLLFDLYLSEPLIKDIKKRISNSKFEFLFEERHKNIETKMSAMAFSLKMMISVGSTARFKADSDTETDRDSESDSDSDNDEADTQNGSVLQSFSSDNPGYIDTSYDADN